MRVRRLGPPNLLELVVRASDSVQNKGHCGCRVRRVDKQPTTVSDIVPGTPLAALNLVPCRNPVTRDVGHAAFNSTLSWTSTGDEPLTVLRAVVTPRMQ